MSSNLITNKPPIDIPINELSNFATHYHHDEEFRMRIHQSHPKHSQSIDHFKKIGGLYCPRVLLSVEYIIKEAYELGIINQYQHHLETTHVNYTERI